MFSSKTWGKSKGGRKMISKANCLSTSLYDLRQVHGEVKDDCHRGKIGIKLSHIWNKRPILKTDNKTENVNNVKKESNVDSLEKCYVTQFVREKENSAKKQNKIEKKKQKQVLLEEQALDKEAESICQEILEIVKINSTPKSEKGQFRVEEPVSILKNKNRDSPCGQNKLLKHNKPKCENVERQSSAMMIPPVYSQARVQYYVPSTGRKAKGMLYLRS